MKQITRILEVSKDKRTGICVAVVGYDVKDSLCGPIKEAGVRSMVVETVPMVGDVISEGV